MNTEQKNLMLVEQRISSLIINKPDGWESTLSYLEFAQGDILSRLTKEEIAEIRVGQNTILSDEEQADELAKQMEEMKHNRDKPAI